MTAFLAVSLAAACVWLLVAHVELWTERTKRRTAERVADAWKKECEEWSAMTVRTLRLNADLLRDSITASYTRPNLGALLNKRDLPS